MDSIAIQIEMLLVMSWIPILIPVCCKKRKFSSSKKNRLEAGGAKAPPSVQTAVPKTLGPGSAPPRPAVPPLSDKTSGSKTVGTAPDRTPERINAGTAVGKAPEGTLDKGTTPEKRSAEVPNKFRSKEYIEGKFLPYPEVREPTQSQKKRRAQELAEDKKAKIASGFYQQNSDEDDTLEHVKSLSKEESEKRFKNLKALFKGGGGGSKEKEIKM